MNLIDSMHFVVMGIFIFFRPLQNRKAIFFILTPPTEQFGTIFLFQSDRPKYLDQFFFIQQAPDWN